MMISVIVGMGEVGKALHHKIASAYTYDINTDANPYDLAKAIKATGDKLVLHIAFPYSPDFHTQVQAYQGMFGPSYTVIHSTVPVGTCNLLDAYHSPVRGVHPKLEASMGIFTTYLAPYNTELTTYFLSQGFKINSVDKPENTEAGKLWSLAAYAVMITLEKEIWDYCLSHDLDFQVVYTHFTETYNQGYNGIDRPHFRRPVLRHIEGPIGGHCVIPGVRMLADSEENEYSLLKAVLDRNFIAELTQL